MLRLYFFLLKFSVCAWFWIFLEKKEKKNYPFFWNSCFKFCGSLSTMIFFLKHYPTMIHYLWKWKVSRCCKKLRPSSLKSVLENLQRNLWYFINFNLISKILERKVKIVFFKCRFTFYNNQNWSFRTLFYHSY